MTQIIIEDYMLECGVCLETFDETCKMLPCQHTFCKRCLECIYAIDRCLRCPQCRILVTSEIDRLPRNYFLLNIIEKIKSHPKEESNLAASGEAMQLLFAITKSEEEAALKAQESELRLQKEKLEIELTLLKSNQPNQQAPGEGLGYYSFHASENVTQENDDDVVSEPEIQTEAEVPSNERLMKQILDEFSDLRITGGTPTTDANVTSPDLTIVVAAVSDENLFNELKCEDLEKYSEIVDNYMRALDEYYKKTCLYDDGESYDCMAGAPLVPMVSLTSSSASSDTDVNSNVDTNTSDEERRNFAYAMELSRQSFVASDEESLFELILKKSEVTDSIDRHKKNIQTLKEKIEVRMAVLKSENPIQ